MLAALVSSADHDAYAMIEEKRGFLDHGSVYPDPQSRLRDPFSIDEPPMPPDDPISQLFDAGGGWEEGSDAWDQYGKLETVEPAGWDDTLLRNFRGNVELDLNGAIKAWEVEFSRIPTATGDALFISVECLSRTFPV